MNEICYLLADSSKSYFYLNEFTIAQKFDEKALLQYVEALKSVMPESAVSECIYQIKSDTQRYMWKKDSLSRARIIDVKSTQQQCKKIKDAWDEAKNRYVRFYKIDTLPLDEQEAAITLSRKKCIKDFVSISKEEHEVFYLGLPVFNASADYAILEIGVEQWPTNSFGYDAIFKRINGKWILIAKINQSEG